MIEAQEALSAIQIASFPHPKKDKTASEKLWKRLSKIAYPKNDHQSAEPMSLEEIQRALKAAMNG